MKVLINASKDWKKLCKAGNCGVCSDECGDCNQVGSDGVCYGD